MADLTWMEFSNRRILNGRDHWLHVCVNVHVSSWTVVNILQLPNQRYMCVCALEILYVKTWLWLTDLHEKLFSVFGWGMGWNTLLKDALFMALLVSVFTQ